MMKDLQFPTFGDLYRAAYAESNLERKALLLSQVRKVLDEWERGLHSVEAIGPKTSRTADLRHGRTSLVA